MADTSNSSDWFNNPQGTDCPGDIKKFVAQKPCTIGFGDSSCVTGFYKLHPDSQSPRVTFSMTKDDLSPTVVFGLQHYVIEIDVEEENTDRAIIRKLENPPSTLDSEHSRHCHMYSDTIYYLCEDRSNENTERLKNSRLEDYLRFSS